MTRTIRKSAADRKSSLWKDEKPSRRQRTIMLNKCGKKCFLGKNISFPICKKNTCKISVKGVHAAYVRARQYRTRGRKYNIVSKKAKRLLLAMDYYQV